MKVWIIGIAVAIIVIAVVCVIIGRSVHVPDGPGMVRTYTPISQETAKEMMARNDGHVIVDVRTPEEFAEGHIPGAICIPNESIADSPPADLPDFDQILLVYCRSGRRSKEAAQKLFDMGYDNVYEFGGIVDWTGEMETGGVPLESVTLAQIEQTDPYEQELQQIKPSAVLVIKANDRIFYASFENNSSAQALIDRLNAGELQLDLHDYGGFEKAGSLPWQLPANDEPITARPGDVILYDGDQLTIYYGENTWSLTKLATIGGATKEDLRAALGTGDVTVTLSLEWSE